MLDVGWFGRVVYSITPFKYFLILSSGECKCMYEKI